MKYEGGFVDASAFRWQTQSRTTQASRHGAIISGRAPGSRIHLFVRPEKLRGATAAPFLYCGEVDFAAWDGEQPITVTWRLREAVPDPFRKALGVGQGPAGIAAVLP